MNKLIEFLHDPEAKGLILGNNGFHAERHSDDRVTVHYDGRLLCDIIPDGFQFMLRTTAPLSELQCRRLTEVFAMLGKTNLRATHDGTAPRIQGIVRGDVMRWQILRQGTTFGVYV
nr:MAG TPA: hypothetical protein [Caudoviricetes sp.]